MRAIPMLLVVVAACSSARDRSHELSPTDARRTLTDHLWLDRMPTSPRDDFRLFVFDEGSKSGVFQDRRIYKGNFEMFTFNVRGNQLALAFPDDNSKARTSFKIEAIDDHEPFDVKLTLDASPRGPKVYYGIKPEQGRAELRAVGVPAMLAP